MIYFAVAAFALITVACLRDDDTRAAAAWMDQWRRARDRR